jgi:hypothetical protein
MNGQAVYLVQTYWGWRLVISDIPFTRIQQQLHIQVYRKVILVHCRDMIEANKVTLKFYRTACRLVIDILIL